jgi:hypothetical protein
LLKGVTSSAAQETYDPEVIGWVGRLDAAGGSASNATIDAVNTFIRSINSSTGLRAKIKRLNLFCGLNLSASLTPLIADVGPSQDTNNNFTSSEYTASTGLTNSSGSGNKYLGTGIDFTDAGISFTDGHIAINTLGSSTSGSYKEWIGRDFATIGSSLTTGKHHFRWGEHLLQTDNTNPQTGTCMGFYLGNGTSTEVSLFLNDNKKVTKAISSNSPSGASASQDFHIFKRNTVYSAPNDFDKTVNFYSIGKSLTDAEAKVLYEAVTAFNHASSREVYDAQNIEAWRWANHRVQEVVGDASTHFNQSLVQIADKWMLGLATHNLRAKISRANLFLGASSSSYGYLSALVPLIIDKGNRTDTNYNFVNSDYNFSYGLAGNGMNKYLDTGYTGGASHLSVVTSSSAKNSIGSVTNNCLIGVLEDTAVTNAGGISISLSKDQMDSYVFSETTSSPISSSEGGFLVSVSSLASQGLYFNGSALSNSSSILGSAWVEAGGKSITVFGLNSYSSSVGSYSDQSIKEYTIGDALSDQEVFNLNSVNTEIERKELTATNIEVYNWANGTVPENGGNVTQQEVDAVDAWMTKVKSVSGLQAKIKRANLMIGSDLATKLVPIISTLGSAKDIAKELHDSDTNLKGINGGASKYIDTTVKLSEFLTNSSGHFSVQQAENFVPNSNGNAHGVFSTDSTKPKFGIQFDNNSVDCHIYNTTSAASFTTTDSPTPSTLWGSSNDGSAVSASLPRGNQAFAVSSDTTAWSLTAPSTGLMDFKFRSCVYSSGGFLARQEDYWFDVYLNGVFAKKYVSPKHRCDVSTTSVNSFAVDVKAGDSVVVKARANELILMILAGEAGGEYIDTSILIGTQDEDVSGLWTANRTSTTSLTLYQGTTSRATSTSEVSGSIVNRDDFVYVLGAYGEDGSTTKDFSSINSHMGFYSLGEGLTAEQVTGLSEAYTTFESTLKRSLDAETWDWAYKRVPENGGSISDTEAASVSAFMTSLKATSGLRDAVRRLNIFGGADLASAMVPLIRDIGASLETNYNFVNTDVDQGLTASTSKYLDLGAAFTDIPNASFQNFHVAASVKGTSLPSSSTAYILGNSNIKLDLNSSSAKLNYASKSVTSSSTGMAFWLASQESSAINLYKDGVSTGSGTFDGSGSDVTNSFILFGSQGESGPVSNFSGRVSLYSIGTALTSAQQSAFNTALTALETALKRGDYLASTNEAWTWANVNVPANGGAITQTQVKAVDKFMTSINGVPNLRSSIKRMNLFVGDDLSAALVPVVSDLGSGSDINNSFVSGDYSPSGLNAGLKSSGTQTLDTTVNAGAVLKDSWHMSFRSPDGVTSSSQTQSVMGAERGFNMAKIGHFHGTPYFALGASSAQTITHNKYLSYVSNFKSPLKKYNGCELNSTSILASSVNKKILESECEKNEGGVSAFAHDAVTNNSKIYDFATMAGSPASETQTIFGDALISFNRGSVDKIKGFYSLVTSPNGAASTVDTKVRLYKDGYKIQDSSLDNVYASPAGDSIAVFGVKNQGAFYPSAGLTINFYCFGNGPETVSTSNTETLDDNFLPNEMNGFLNELDRDLNRGGYSVHSSTPLITSQLDPEVADWANNRVPRAGGKLDDSIVKHVDTFMKAIKAESGLRSKLYRCNLFAGSNLHAALVPLVSDKGHPVDVNKGSLKFLEADYLLSSGLEASSSVSATVNTLAEKYLDTGLKAGNLLSNKVGHMSFATSDDTFNVLGLDGVLSPMSLLDEESLYEGNIFMGIYQAGGSGATIWYNHIWGKKTVGLTSGNWISAGAKFPKNKIFLINAQSDYNGSLRSYVDGDGHGFSIISSFGEASLPENSTVTLFAKAFGKDSNHDKQGGAIIPSRSSLVPILLGDGKYYIFALSDEEYTLANLVEPSGFSESETSKKYIYNKYGYGWSSVSYDDIQSLWTTTASDSNLQLGRLLQDLKHQHKYDKAIGWLDIQNGEGQASDLTGYETRLLLHNNQTKGLNSYRAFDSNTASKTIIRNVTKTKTDKACSTCGYSLTRAPLLIKMEVSNPSASPLDVYQSWNKTMSFYSIGGTLSSTDVSTLNTAYKAFATNIGRTVL